MNVQEYIDWHSSLKHDEFYDMCPDLADPKAIGLTYWKQNYPNLVR